MSYYTITAGDFVDIQRETGDGRGKFVARCTTSAEAQTIIEALELHDIVKLIGKIARTS
jgi:hypothetical protein